MRVVLEVNSVLTNRYSGFFTYGAGLLEGFAQLDDRPEFTLFCGWKFRQNVKWLSDLPERLTVEQRFSRIKMRHLGLLWRWADVPSLRYFTGDFDLYHCNHHLMPPTGPRPRVLTVHDLRRYRYPEFYPDSKLAPFENAVRKADHFIAISQATKADLQEFFGIPDERIDVVYHGGPLGRAEPCGADPLINDELIKQYGLRPGRYFTTFSSYDKRKNLPAVVRSFLQTAEELGDDYRLVIIGQPPKKEDILPKGTKNDLAERVILTGPLDDFSSLLRCGTALVYTSLYEGFGLPILEAMSLGTAVITSNCSSMPEVAGSAALLVDPTCRDDIGEAMKRIASDEQLRAKLIESGNLRAKQFSWRKAARETMAVYKKLVGLV